MTPSESQSSGAFSSVLPDPITDLALVRPASEFAGWVIAREAGHGAMSRVMLGRHRESNELFAIKMLDPALAKQPGLLERFEREARVIGRLDHPAIVDVHEIDRFHGVHYIVMEYVRGRNLQKILGRSERQVFTPRLAADIVRTVAEALLHAFEQGLIHRDVKLDNIMITREHEVKVLDFGCALDTTESPETDGVIIGSPNYISPEQARGKPVDFRTDMYALGICFYYMLTGRFPFIAMDTLALIRKHVNQAPKAPSDVNPSIPPDVEACVLRMLEKDPDARFASWDELLDELDAIVAVEEEEGYEDLADDTVDRVPTQAMFSSQVMGVFGGRPEPPVGDGVHEAETLDDEDMVDDDEDGDSDGDGEVPIVDAPPRRQPAKRELRAIKLDSPSGGLKRPSSGRPRRPRRAGSGRAGTGSGRVSSGSGRVPPGSGKVAPPPRVGSGNRSSSSGSGRIAPPRRNRTGKLVPPKNSAAAQRAADTEPDDTDAPEGDATDSAGSPPPPRRNLPRRRLGDRYKKRR